MNNKYKTTAFLALLFIFLAIFWGFIGNYFFTKNDNESLEINSTNYNSVIPILYVKNVKKTLEFYCDILGFGKKYKAGNVIYISNGNASVGLVQKDGIVENNINIELYFEIHNIKAYHNKLKEIIAGLKELKEESGMLAFEVNDADGIKLKFYENIFN